MIYLELCQSMGKMVLLILFSYCNQATQDVWELNDYTCKAILGIFFENTKSIVLFDTCSTILLLACEVTQASWELLFSNFREFLGSLLGFLTMFQVAVAVEVCLSNVMFLLLFPNLIVVNILI